VVDVFEREQRLLLDVPREKLTRLLSYFGSLFVFPLLVALVVGFLEHSATNWRQDFSPDRSWMAVLSPLLSAVLAHVERRPHRHQGR
jgi:hypothetical protein